MKGVEFVESLNSRSKMYKDGRVMDPKYSIALKVDPIYASKFETQVSLMVAANLLSRMTSNIAFDIPDVTVHKSLPWQLRSLPQVIKNETCLGRPDQNYQFRSSKIGDYVLNIGPQGGHINVHGSGWFGFVGITDSPLPQQNSFNPVGASLAAIMAVTLLFDVIPRPILRNYIFDAFKWKADCKEFSDHPYSPFSSLGNIWFLGVGSVGSSALYFLSLATRNFQPLLIDMDQVKIENMDRSAIFQPEHVDQDKVFAAENFLKNVGVSEIRTEAVSFSESCARLHRQAGEPDIFISAANEQDVRQTIEHGLPPIQLYATTGENWQATLLRHIPFVDPCSCCIFPPKSRHVEYVCGGGEVEIKETGEKIDASLPFLSFMAGLMTAAEILKLQIPEYPFTPQRVTFFASPKQKVPRFINQGCNKRSGCICQHRHNDIHHEIITGSKYAYLSGR